MPNSSSSLACRVCHDLAYRSQRLSRVERLKLKSQQLYSKIGGRGARLGTKPRGMHQKTFLRRLLAAKKSENRARALEIQKVVKADLADRRELNQLLGFPVSEERFREYELATERFLEPLKQIAQ